MGILSILLLIPLFAVFLLLFVPEEYSKAIKGITALVTGVTFVASLTILGLFQKDTYHFQLIENIPWIQQFGISYKVGIDGISLWLVLLTTLLTFLCVIFSHYVEKRIKSYMIMVLMLETAMLGVFMSLDLILFYTFFEASLIPMALMIWIWGGENRNKAAIKFFIYTFAASIFMLIGILVLANQNAAITGQLTFDLIKIQSTVASGKLWAGLPMMQALIFWSFALAFMVQCPMFPFHTWLPDAHTEAPTAGSIILAGVLLKMGTYGFLRFLLPLFPDISSGRIPALTLGGVPFSAPAIMLFLAVIGIIYGAIVAAMQPDIKKLVAYSSVSHMGFVVLGIYSLNQTGMMGGALQQLNHGISTGALFLLIGLLYERIHTRMFNKMGGLKAQMPVYAALFLIVMLSSVGLPGLNGFVGEFAALLGSFQSGIANTVEFPVYLPVAAGVGVVLSAVYLLWMFQKTFYGKITNPDLMGLKDIKPWEVGLVGVFIVFIFWGGLYPLSFTAPMEKSIAATRQMVLNPGSKRPTWEDLSLEIHDRGHLVRVRPRMAPGPITNGDVIDVISDGSLYPLTTPEIPVQIAKGESHEEEKGEGH